MSEIPAQLEKRLLAHATRLSLTREAAMLELLDWALDVHENVAARLSKLEDKIAATTSMAMQHKRSKGEYIGGTAPYGFKIAADGVALVPIATEQAVIAEARALRAAGLSLRAIAAALDEKGVQSRARRRFDASQIARMVDAQASGGTPF